MGKNRILLFAVAPDGAKITNNLFQVISVFEVVDIAAVDPLANPLVKRQTRNACWTMRIVLGRETEAMRTNYVNNFFQLVG